MSTFICLQRTKPARAASLLECFIEDYFEEELNVGCLVNNLSYFHSILLSKSVRCFCVTEIWLSSSICDAEIITNNYHIYWCNRASKGGGVLIAVTKLLKSRQLLTYAALESVMVENWVWHNFNLHLCSQLLACIRSLPDDQDLSMVGDFNLPHHKLGNCIRCEYSYTGFLWLSSIKT